MLWHWLARPYIDRREGIAYTIERVPKFWPPKESMKKEAAIVQFFNAELHGDYVVLQFQESASKPGVWYKLPKGE